MAKRSRRKKGKGKAPQERPAGGVPAFLRLSPDAEEQPPWRMLPAWLAVAFALRAAVSLAGDFVLHPDEIMQYLEPAHLAVFGNGVVYWEFLYGARSWLVPGLVAGVLWAMDAAGLGEPRYYVDAVKLVFCAISLLVPWGCYHFARATFGEQCARISLVLACLWPYLVVFAHKPFTEFVSTAALFAALGLAVRKKSGGAAGAVAFGALLALAAALRMQYLPAAGLIWLFRVLAADRKWALASVAGGIAVLAFVGAVETATWGLPFHSYYANVMFNLEFDKARDADPLLFYLPRLLFATAGGALVGLLAFVTEPRKHVVPLCLVLFTLLLHMTQTHKEFRFVFLILPLLLVVMASQVARLSAAAPKLAGLGSAAAVTSLLLVLVGGNLVDDSWMHTAASRERGEVHYVFGQNNIFEKYLELSEDETVKGVAHLSDPFFNTPGYYYLHRDVPFYDGYSISTAVAEANVVPSGLATHIVALREHMPDDPGLLVTFDEGGEYGIARFLDASSVKQWKSHRINIADPGTAMLARRILGLPATEVPKSFEFSDGP